MNDEKDGHHQLSTPGQASYSSSHLSLRSAASPNQVIKFNAYKRTYVSLYFIILYRYDTDLDLTHIEIGIGMNGQ